MPSYQELRKRLSFIELIKDHDAAADATLSVIDVCDPDALVIFSDILTVLASLGAEVSYEPKVEVKAPPLDALPAEPNDEWLNPAYRTLRRVQREAGDRKAIIGFAGAPFTLFTYLMGQGPDIRAAMLRDPVTARNVLDVLARTVATHLRRQYEAGADVLQLFDTAAGELPPHLYDAFALPPLRSVLEELDGVPCPIIVFARGRHHVDRRAELGTNVVLSVDWTVALDTLPDRAELAVQGNLDPVVLRAGPDVTRRQTERMLKAGAGLGGHIANLGHGVLPGTPVESVQEFVSTVKLYDVMHPPKG
jgi:uroporphyrinogen decarboxylase